MNWVGEAVANQSWGGGNGGGAWTRHREALDARLPA